MAEFQLDSPFPPAGDQPEATEKGQKGLTTHSYRGYVFTITYFPTDPAFTVEFPDIKDIITSGSTLSEAFANGCEALDLHLESLQELGIPLPESRHCLVVETAGAV
jgi:predicted RNase H-like HicB family nuclease